MVFISDMDSSRACNLKVLDFFRQGIIIDGLECESTPLRATFDVIALGRCGLIVDVGTLANETEAAILSGCQDTDLHGHEGLRRVGRWFLDKQVRNVIITLGSRGVYYCTGDGRNGLLPAHEVDVVDTTAAGDTFVGSYCISVVTSRHDVFDVKAAVEKADDASARTVQMRGAQVSIPWRDELSY